MRVVEDTECTSIHAVIIYSLCLPGNIQFEHCTVYTCFQLVACKYTMYENSSAFTPHSLFVPKLDGNMLEQDPIVGIVPSKSVMSLTGHLV